MVVLCIIVVVLICFLIWIIFSALNKDDVNEKIFRDFFRFFRKIDLDPEVILLYIMEYGFPQRTGAIFAQNVVTQHCGKILVQ